MVSVLQPFFTSAAMDFNHQQSEQEQYAQYWAQFANYPQVSQQSSIASQSAVVAPSQSAWNGNFSMGSFTQPATYYEEPQSFYQQPEFFMPATSQTPSVSISQVSSYQSSPAMTFTSPHHSYAPEPAVASSSSHQQRHSRTFSCDSYASHNSLHAPSPEASESGFSRSSSPGSSDMGQYGYLNSQGTWSCNFPGCTSRAVFTRGCDLRKHHKRHTKSFFCRYPTCSQSTGGGFSSKKDLARHEAKHNPGVVCEWEGCDRVFSRVDNMRDHVKRIHHKAAKRQAAARHVSQSSPSHQ